MSLTGEMSPGAGDDPDVDGGEESVHQQERWVRRNWPQLLVAVLVSIPALRMASWIGSGTHVQFADYWVFISELINPDGSVRWGALMEFQGQHILSVPFLIYLVNIWLFGGSNITLGMIVVGVVIAQIALLWNWLRRLDQIPFALRGALLGLASALLFSPYGAWNFIRAMSGTAWLTSNLVVMIAIHLAVRGRIGGSIAAAVVATFTYGTGVLVCPVLVLVAIVRRSSVRSVVAVSGAAAVVGGGYIAVRSSQVWTSTVSTFNPWEVTTGVIRLFGRLAGAHHLVVWIVGLAVLVSSLALIALALLRCRDRSLPFVALLTYGLLASGQIVYGRGGGLTIQSRYTSLVALVWLSTAVLLVMVLRTFDLGRWTRSMAAALFVAICLVAASSPFRGQAEVTNSLDESARIVRLSDAQRLKISRGSTWFYMVEQPDIDGRLERIGHHPFDSRWNADCGWLGRVFDHSADPTDGQARLVDGSHLPDGLRISGWLDVRGAQIACMILLSDTDEVVGVGRTYPKREVSRGTAMEADAPLTSNPVRLVAYLPQADRWVEVGIVDRREGAT